MVIIPTGELEEKAKKLLKFETFGKADDFAEVLKKVAADLVNFLNAAVPDSRLTKGERIEYVRQSILVALDDAAKVGTELLAGSIAKEKTRDVLKRIESAQEFVKLHLSEILDLKLVVSESLADGKLELREVVEIAEVARKIDWSALLGCLAACFSKKAVAAAEPVPAPASALPVVPPLPESPIPQPPLTQLQEVPELQEVPQPPQSSVPPQPSGEKSPENDEVDHP
jgi:hypothetical protein